MTARPVRERLIAFAAGELSPTDRQAIDELLMSDERFRNEAAGTLGNCRFLAERLGHLKGLVEPDLTVLEEAPDPVMEESAEAASRRPVLLAAVAALLAVAVGGWFFFAGDGKEAPVEEGAATTVKKVAEATPEKETAKEPEPETKEEPPPENPGPAAPGPTVVKPGVAMLLPALLKNPNQLTMEKIWAALRERPDRASAVTKRIPSITDEKKRATLVLVLAAANSDGNVRSTLAFFLRSDSSPLVRRAAAGALGYVSTAENERVQITGQLTVQTGKIEDAERRSQLIQATEAERDPTVLAVLIRMLGPSQRADPSITELILELARSKDENLRSAAFRAISAGEGARPAVITRLVQDSAIPASDRLLLVPALARGLQGLNALENLIAASSEKAIRVAAVRALPRVGLKGYIPVAIRVLRDTRDDREVRLAALEVVGALGPDKRAQAAIREAAERDPDEAVKLAAKELLRVKDPEKEKK